MKEILEKYGWSMYHNCNCGGVYKEFFSHPDYVGYKIIIKPHRNRFVAKKLNLTVKDANNYQLEDYLKTF